MDAFLQYNFTFPVVFYAGLLVIVVLFWLTTLLGMMDMDMLDSGGDMDFDADGGHAGSWLNKVKFEGVPLTVSLSLLILCSWLLCFVGVYFIYPRVSEEWLQMFLGVWLLILAPVMAVLIVSPLVQPLQPLFKNTPDASPADILGQYATVRTGKVTPIFGEASFEDGGAGLLLRIRAQEPNALRKGDRVRLVSFDPVTHSYQVVAVDS